MLLLSFDLVCLEFSYVLIIILLCTDCVSNPKLFLGFAHREKKMSRNSAIKVLNHAMTGAEGQDNCQKFIEILGLRSLFPLFMKTPKQAKAGPSPDELEGSDDVSCLSFFGFVSVRKTLRTVYAGGFT